MEEEKEPSISYYTSVESNSGLVSPRKNQELLNLPPKGQKCLQDFWDSLPLDGVYCNATWDSLYCWPATQAGRIVNESCATVFSDVPDLLHYPDALAYRECDVSGSWLWGNWTNYSQCLSVIDHQTGSFSVVEAVRYITFIGAILSLLTLSLTIFIFTYFRTLECDRLRVHRNLVVSLIIHFLVMLVLSEPFIFHRQSNTYRDVDWVCKTLLALTMYAQMASINWMFVEGLFLHSRLTSNVFDSGAPFAIYYTIGWGVPLVFIIAWATTMYFQHEVHCWRSYSNLPHIWILVAPMVTALLINLVFLVNIIRILVTKLRASDAVETTQVRKAIRATAVLFPLLGITNLLFAVNPGKGDLEGAYMLSNALIQSSQGVFVSVLYCFLNSEVQELLRKRWQQYRTRRLGYPALHYRHRRSTRTTSVFDTSVYVKTSPQPNLRHPEFHALNTHGGDFDVPTHGEDFDVLNTHGEDFGVLNTHGGDFDVLDTNGGNFNININGVGCNGLSSHGGKFDVLTTRGGNLDVLKTHCGDFNILKTCDGDFNILKTHGGDFDVPRIRSDNFNLLKTHSDYFDVLNTTIYSTTSPQSNSLRSDLHDHKGSIHDNPALDPCKLSAYACDSYSLQTTVV
ncbi:corticotropin-releasing factor receptor 2 [Cherax quadricarinatus]|uniref:corticotropin-releasing factor receptor 2 n=1 Tax=Cherax quadricarinatus TaxID=27406 RepID=UPI00387E8C3B